ncbi:hypothetical protein B0H14DRAFT_3757670 [Mycena olivaceomarginata]|nr:hypothetical protein B0H14DRAFT_3757670 [Mycena olivaceomarginata]
MNITQRASNIFLDESKPCWIPTLTAGSSFRGRLLQRHISTTMPRFVLDMEGGECIITAVLCPVTAFDHHEGINHSPPPNTPPFAFRSDAGWRHLTKDLFLQSSAAIFRSSGLDLVFGHSYRIGGSLELLTAGVAPEVVMKIGGWTSLCFLIYWRRLERISPLANTSRVASRNKANSLMSSTDELSNVVPTSDPYEELLGPSPLRSSDPYEEVNIPGFSQRDETRDAVDAEFKSLHDHASEEGIAP